MTSEQAAWLQANKEYRALGQAGGNSRFTRRGTLRPDGTFVRATRATPLDEANGSFGVGVLMVHEPGRPGELRDPRGSAAPAGGLSVAPPSTAPMAGPRPLPRKA